MQVSPSPRQLISGKIGWGWRQATYPISTNFGFAGLLILTIAIAQLVKADDLNLVVIACVLLIFGFVVGLYTAKSVVITCRENEDYIFSHLQLSLISGYWLALIAALGNFSGIFAKSLMAVWWVLPAAILIGIASYLIGGSLLTSNKPNPNKQPRESINPDLLNIITYSDQTALISPSAIGQQPRQFNSLVMIILGFFCWTMLDFPPNLRAIAAICLTSAGLTGFFTWQIQARSPDKVLYMRFSGLWGMSSAYSINLRHFSTLSVVKLQESGGEISWMQLSGHNHEITMPLATTTASPVPSNQEELPQDDQLSQIIRDKFHLAKQETERDSLSLASVLLPQGAGILAGIAFITLGGLLLLIFPLPPKLLPESAIAWFGVCLVSPAIAKFLLHLVAPNCLQSDRQSHTNNYLQSWQIGTAILLVSAFLSSPSSAKVISLVTFNQTLPLVNLICGWLSITIGVCILSLVRRTPLCNVN
jgi:hypothetical protein